MSGDDLPPIPPSSRARRAREAETRRSSRAVLSASDIAGIVVLGVVGLAVAAVLAVVIAGNLFQRDPPGAAATSPSPTASRRVSTSPTPTPTASAGADTPWTGRIRAARIASAHGSCGQHDLRTPDGQIAQFQGAEAIDGRARTAWRCAGDGVGRRLRVKLLAPVRVAALGLVPGFAATDPITGQDGFTTDRRVLRVEWSLGGRVLDQTLRPTREKTQLLRIPPTVAGSITLTILATAPAEQDVFAVSDIGVYAVR